MGSYFSRGGELFFRQGQFGYLLYHSQTHLKLSVKKISMLLMSWILSSACGCLGRALSGLQTGCSSPLEIKMPLSQLCPKVATVATQAKPLIAMPASHTGVGFKS